MRDDLRGAPVHCRVGGSARQDLGRDSRLPHFLGGQRDLQLDAESAAIPVRLIAEIRQRLRIAGRPIELEALLGAPREIARARGIGTPALDRLYGVTKLMAESLGLA